MKILKMLLIMVFIAGCSTISGINRLQDLSLSRDEQEVYVREQENKFKQLLKDFSSGAIKNGVSREKIIEMYGEPITIKEIKTGSSAEEELMYRHPAQFFGSEKIFMYFDKNGNLRDIKYQGQS